MTYLTYEEYQSYGGSLDETTFSDLAFEAQAKINWVTFNRLKDMEEIPEAVKRLMYRLISLIEAKRSATSPVDSGDSESAITAGIASQSNDGVSISYNVLSARDVLDQYDKDVKAYINQYLQDVTNDLGRKVLYRGLYPGE